MLLHASALLIGRRLVEDTARVPDDIDLAVLPAPCPLSVQPIDFGQADWLINQARDGARRYLADGERGAVRAAGGRMAA